MTDNSMKPGQSWPKDSNPNPFAGIVPKVAPRCEIQPPDHFVGKSGFVAPTNSADTAAADKGYAGPPPPPPPPPPTPEDIAATIEIDPAVIVNGYANQDTLPVESIDADTEVGFADLLEIRQAVIDGQAAQIKQMGDALKQLQLKYDTLVFDMGRKEQEIKDLKRKADVPTGAAYDERGQRIKTLEAENAALEQQLKLSASARPANVVEVKTLIQHMVANNPEHNIRHDKDLAQLLADGWIILNISVTPDCTRIVTLRRDPQPAPAQPEKPVVRSAEVTGIFEPDEVPPSPADEPKTLSEEVDQLQTRLSAGQKRLEQTKRMRQGVQYGQL